MVKYSKYPFLVSGPIRLFTEDMKKGQYRSALLTLKDIGEAIIKFYGVTLFSDAVENILKNNNETIKLKSDLLDIVTKLFLKPPALGDWLDFYFKTAILLKKEDLIKSLVFPEIVDIVSQGKQLKCNSKEAKILREFVSWRNDSIGHGTTSHNTGEIKKTIDQKIDQLIKILEKSHFMGDLEIYSADPSGKGLLINWNVDKLIPLSSKPQLDWDYNVRVRRISTNKSFSISPLVISRFINDSKDQGIYSLLTFDKIRKGYFFLDCFYGKKIRFPSMPLLDQWVSSLEELGKIKLIDQLSNSDLLNNMNITYSKKLLQSFDQIEFGSDTQKKYVNPTEQINAIQQAVCDLNEKFGNGYIHVIGEAGMGKSWISFALKHKQYFGFANSVVKYHIRVGMRQNPEIFVASMCEQVANDQGHAVQTRIQFEKFSEKREAVKHFFEEVLEKSYQNQLILVLDGIDELLDLENGSIVDYLPFAHDLPEDVIIILFSRPEQELRSQAFHFINQIKSSDNYRAIDLKQFNNERKLLFKTYLIEKCAITNDHLIQRAIKVSKDSFLMLSLLGKLYYGFDKQSTYDELPSTIDELYSNYLSQLKLGVGGSIFEKLYMKVLLILAFSPIPLDLFTISDLTGIKEEKVVFTLFDIGHFFNIHREKDHDVFSIVHEKLTEFLLINFEKELQVLFSEIDQAYKHDEEIIDWLIEGNKKLQFMGTTDLSIYLSEILLNKIPCGSLKWLTVMYSYIDMIHIQGDYLRAAQMYSKLANELLTSYGYQKTSHEYIKYKIREAHHLKFVAPIDQPRLILEDLLLYVDENSKLYNELLFGLYGSIGCLKDPGVTMLEKLLEVASNAKSKNEMYLYSKCLRRIVDLYLLLGDINKAKEIVGEAIEIAERMQTRQRIYLFSTEAEIFRFQRVLDKSLLNHKFTLEYAEKRGLAGWAGHGALGIAETYRMMGMKEQALESLNLAFSYYQKANNQTWGIIHTLISRYMLTLQSEMLDEALDLSKKRGYQYEIRYITGLRNKTITMEEHNDHFLLFP